jgi:hypothetical protein
VLKQITSPSEKKHWNSRNNRENGREQWENQLNVLEYPLSINGSINGEQNEQYKISLYMELSLYDYSKGCFLEYINIFLKNLFSLKK